MKISFETKILVGYVVNLVVVILLGVSYWGRAYYDNYLFYDEITTVLLLLSLVMLTIVYMIFRYQINERKQIELSLQRNKDLLQSIIDNTNNPISVKKINGEYLLINKKYGELFNFNEEEIKGKTDQELLPAKIAERYRAADLEAVKFGKEIHIEETIDQSDGSNTYLSVKFPLQDDSKRIYAVATISTNITQRKAVENSLKAGDLFFNMSVDLLFISDKNKFIKTNPAVGKLLGYSQKELTSQPFTAFVFPEDIEATQKTINKIQQGESFINIKNRVVCKDGTVKTLSWSVTVDEETGLLYAVARDETDKILREEEEKEALKVAFENEQKLALILENITDGVIVADTDKNVLLANYMANELFGIEDDSKIPVNFSEQFELFFPDEKTTFPGQDLPMAKAFEGYSTDDVDVVLWDPNSRQKRRVLLSGRPIIDQDNNVVAAVVTIKDISRYKMLEEELKETRKIIGFNKNKEDKK